METIRESIDTFLETQDKKLLVNILELLKTEEDLYTVLVRVTNNFYMGIEQEKPAAYLFTGRENADNFARELRWGSVQAKCMEIKPEQRITFFCDLYRSGIEAVAINKGENCLLLSLFGIIDKPGEDESTLMNPRFVRAGNQFYQAIARKHIIKPMQDIVCLEFYGAKLLSPLQAVAEGEGRNLVERTGDTVYGYLGNQDGKKFLPAFTDWNEFAKYDKKKNHNATLLEFADFKKLIRKVDGICVNPFGFNMILDKEKMELIENLALSQNEKIIPFNEANKK